MEITDFLGIAVVGAVLSFIIQAVKGKWGVESTTTKLITVGLAIGVGLLYTYFRSTQWWSTILVVLGSASTVYALLLKK